MSTCTILALTAALLSQAPVRLELFPRPEPVVLKMFPDAEPVTLKLFPDPIERGVEDPEKHLVPPPIEQPPAAPKLIEVRFYSKSDCTRCVVAKREYHEAMNRGELLPFVFVDKPAPEWVEQFPTLHYPSRLTTTGWDHTGGWPGLAVFTRRVLKANPPRKSMQGAQPIRRVELSTRELIRLLPPVPHVGVNGDIVYHLREHGWTGSLQGLSYHELDRLHDAIHAGAISPNGQVRTESRSRFMNRLQRTRHLAGMQPKRIDPFTVITILSLVLDLSKFFCPNG